MKARRHKKGIKLNKNILIAFLFFLNISFFAWVLFLNKANKIFNYPADSTSFAKIYKDVPPHYHNPFHLTTPILLYHYVEYVTDLRDTIRQGLDVLPRTFENHLKLIKENNYTTYFLRDLPNILNGKIPYEKKSIILTFDDGYGDFYTDAFPLLKKYQMKATVYIIYDFIGKKNYMDAAQIQEIINSGLIEIGSHTLTHPNLTAISEQEAEHQIKESKILLENRFNVKVETFCYPYGVYSSQVAQVVKKVGYTAAVATYKGIDESFDNLFYLPRLRGGGFGYGSLITSLERMKNK